MPFSALILSIIVLFCAQAANCQRHGDLVRVRSLAQAVKAKKNSLVRKLLKQQADPNGIDQDGSTPLHWACYLTHETDNMRCVELLIEHGARVNTKDQEGWTPLHWAIEKLYYKQENTTYTYPCLELLIDKGADVNVKDNNGYAPLYYLIRNIRNHYSGEETKACLKLLIDKGADVNAKDNNGFALLHHAINCKNINLAKLLLERDADVNIQDSNGNSALHYAVDFPDKQQLIELLMKYKANPDIKNNQEETVLEQAQAKQLDDEIITLLSTKEEPTTT